MIPRKGRMRVLSLFFQRIILVFLVIYVPTFILLIFFWYLDSISFWGFQIFFIIAAVQVPVTLVVVLRKPDIAKVVFCGRDGFCKRNSNEPRWSVVQTKVQQWCCGWSKKANTNPQTAVPATSEWVMDDVYDAQPSSATGNVEDGDALEDGDDVEDDDVRKKAIVRAGPRASAVEDL